MSAFIIGRMQIHKKDWMDEYFSKVPELIEQHEGKFVVRGGGPKLLEGEEGLPDAVFVIEFPSREQAEKFWSCDEFQPLVALRQTGSTLNAMLVDKL
ncbi:DUF1330 domain-containing protein [Sneathiella limimaris]|uniref:DUF1330 domain-containing protein n=1 Tax=Sneathiella limimaris TaxID=1964213 RepID=UPI00146BE5C7|nr:DUF1330 domain-containing protein [Sneathiella limimaris]